MNYNIPWVARRVERYLKHRYENERDPEVPFSMVESMVGHLGEVDRTPRWVVVAAVGYLIHQGSAAVRVWKRDQSDVDEVKVSYRRPPPAEPAEGPKRARRATASRAPRRAKPAPLKRA